MVRVPARLQCHKKQNQQGYIKIEAALFEHIDGCNLQPIVDPLDNLTHLAHKDLVREVEHHGHGATALDDIPKALDQVA